MGKVSIIDVHEEDMELFKMTAEEETRIAKIQAAYRGKKDRKLVAKKKEQKELQDWTDEIGDEADQMARKLQAIHAKKNQRKSKPRTSQSADLEGQMANLQRSKREAEEKKMKKRKSEVIQSGATGGVDTMFAALADEDLHGFGMEGDFDISQLSEEHQAQLMIAQNATESSSEVMRKKKEAEQRQRAQELRWQHERREQELKEWALAFGVDGDDAARKIQMWWRGGSAKLMALKAREQVAIETYTDMGDKKGTKKGRKTKDDKVAAELKEWEQSIDPKELNDAAVKVQSAQRRKGAKKVEDKKLKKTQTQEKEAASGSSSPSKAQA